MGSRKGSNIMAKQPGLLGVDEQDSLSAGSGSAQKKRKCIPTACEQCRKRKSRCDGQKPECSACRFVYKTSCSFNEAESAATSPVEAGQDSTQACSSLDHEVVKVLLEAPPARISDLVGRLRAAGDAASFVEELRKDRSLTPSSDSQEQSRPSHPKLGNISSEPLIMDLRTMRDLVTPGYEMSSPKSTGHQPWQDASVEGYSWTSVTPNKKLVAHLVKLYFTWSDPFYLVLSKRHFEREFLNPPSSNERQYCSELLVNALCAFGSLFSDRPDLPEKVDKSDYTGKVFLDEAKRLLDNELAAASLTTVQALGVMAIYEISSGHIQRGSLYNAMCMRMALDMNMHRDDQDYQSMDPDRAEATIMTFWGCFILDCAWAKFVARTPLVTLTEIVLDKVPNNPLKKVILPEQVPRWLSYTDNSSPENSPDVEQDLIFLQQFVSLSKIINSMAHSYYASGQNVSSMKLLEYHGMFLSWFNQLPPHLQYRTNASPAVMCLHVYYSSCIIHLFMPLSRHKIVNSKVVPRNVCTEQAYRITDIARDYRRHWGFRHTFLPLSHILMTAMYVYIDNWPREIAREKLSQSLTDLVAMSPGHSWAKRCVTMIVNWAAEQGKDIFYVPPPPAFPQLKDPASPANLVNKPTDVSDPRVLNVAGLQEGYAKPSLDASSTGLFTQLPHTPAESNEKGHLILEASDSQKQQLLAATTLPMAEDVQGSQEQLYHTFPRRIMPLQHTDSSQQMPMDLPKIMNGYWGHLGYMPLEEWNENMVDKNLAGDLSMAPFTNANDAYAAHDVDSLQHSAGFHGYPPVEEQRPYQGQDNMSSHASLTQYNMLSGYNAVQAQHSVPGPLYTFSPADAVPASMPEPTAHGPDRPLAHEAYPGWASQQ